MNTPDNPAQVTALDRDGVRYVPLASIVQQLGGKISWDNAAKRASLEVRGRSAEVDMNDRIVKVDGAERILNATPIIEQGHVYVTEDFLDQIGLTHA